VTKWDILLSIVQPDEKNTRRETRGNAHTIEDEEPPTKIIKEQIEVLFF
jgi:hypothetical protein